MPVTFTYCPGVNSEIAISSPTLNNSVSSILYSTNVSNGSPIDDFSRCPFSALDNLLLLLLKPT